MKLAPVPGAAGAPDRSRHSLPWPMIGATVTVLAAAFALQLAVYRNGGSIAISDLPRVLLHRGIGPGALPYIDRVHRVPGGLGDPAVPRHVDRARTARRARDHGGGSHGRCAW